jgi:predicted Fe-Mo cluster-binding NifX family protein
MTGRFASGTGFAVTSVSEVTVLKVAIPRYGETVAPCFEYSATIAIFSIKNKKIVDQVDFSLQSQDVLDRLRLLKDQEVDVLICGGIQDRFEELVQASKIQTISWISGTVEVLLEQFIAGRLVSGKAREGQSGDDRKSSPSEM